MGVFLCGSSSSSGGGSYNFLKLVLVIISLLQTCTVSSSSSSSSVSLDRFDQAGGASHPYESYARPHPPPAAGGGWGSGSAGSYYHYHVPLVGQQSQGWGWAPEGGHHGGKGHDILLWVLVGLLLLGLLGSLLLPLLLIPLGLSLLALLMGGMMMMAGGGMMMMMMMMMMPQPQAARTELVGRALETVSKIVAGDTEGAFVNILSTLELESYCPEKALCNMGHSLSGIELPLGLGLDLSGVVEQFSGWRKKKGGGGSSSGGGSWLMDLAPFLNIKNPRGSRMIKRMEKAFLNGLSSGNCTRLEKRCKKLRDQQKIRNDAAGAAADAHYMTSSTNSSSTDYPYHYHGHQDDIGHGEVGQGETITTSYGDDSNHHPQPQPHAVILQDEHETHHPQLIKPTFSTPTILM